MRHVLVLLMAVGCSRVSSEPPERSIEAAAKAKEAFPKPAPPQTAMTDGPLRVEELDPHLYPPVFVTRGGEQGPAKLVFLHGLCGHGLGYAQSFQESAAAKGTLIAPQGDVLCGKGPASSWSGNVENLNARILDAFRELGAREPIEDMTVIGYSQGASRAMALARAYPDRYSHLILMGGPEKPSPAGLLHLKSVVTMAGERDRQDLMKAGQRLFESAGVPATYLVIPEAVHGAMGPTPEKTMDLALDWLFEHQR
jgi:predicted esterase